MFIKINLTQRYSQILKSRGSNFAKKEVKYYSKKFVNGLASIGINPTILCGATTG